MSDFFNRSRSGRLNQNPSTIQGTDFDKTTANVPVAVRSDPTYGTYRTYADGTTQGRTIRAVVLRSAPVALVSNTAKTVTSISIPANSSWIISAGVGFVDGAGTTHTLHRAGVSKTTNTLPSLDTIVVPTAGEVIGFSFVGAFTVEVAAGFQSYRYDNTTNQAVTLYLVAINTFAVSTCSAFGSIEAVSIM